MGRVAVGDRAQDWPLRRRESELAEFNIERPEQSCPRRRNQIADAVFRGVGLRRVVVIY
jgi:hypothetical protein